MPCQKMKLGDREMKKRGKELVDRFKEERGFTSPWHEIMVEYDPEFFERYIDWSSHMYRKGVLPAKTKELILIAVDAAATHLHGPGTRVHIRNALNRGASKEEILEVLELVTLVGIHSCHLGIPILKEELRNFEATRKRAQSGKK